MAAGKFVGLVRHCSDTLVSTYLFCDYVAQANELQSACFVIALRKLINTNLPIVCLHNANYRVAVGLLEGQGWEPKRPTLPSLRTEKPTL